MALNFLKPVTTDLMATILTDIKDMFNALVKMEPTSASNIPTDAKRWSVTNGRFEIWNGSAWVALQADASTTVRGPVLLSSSTSSTSTVLGATAAAIKTVYDYAVAGFAALNGSNITTGTVAAARLPAATTSAVGAVQLSSSTSSESTTLAATASAVKAAYDYAVAGFAALNASNLTSGTVPLARRGYTAAVTNHVRAGNVQLFNGVEGSGTSVNVGTAVTESAWETVGPTGSGADNIWTMLDSLPSSARILMATCYLEVKPSGTSEAVNQVWAAAGGVTPVEDNVNLIASLTARLDNTSDSVSMRTEVMIPLDSNRMFQIRHYGYNETSLLILLYYKGFMTDE